jgi:hypothetical protein
MAILSGDIVLAASQVMADVPEGGGAPSSTLIVDGLKNGIFPDISELDRTLGRVNVRKVFPSVHTANVDGYNGVTVIVSEPPEDPNVSVALFSTGEVFDTRQDAVLRVESYLAQGPTYPGYLYGNAITGQASITILQRNELPLPANGDTIVLVVNEGMATEEQQFVRVTGVKSQVRIYTDEQSATLGDFSRTEVTMTLSDTLRYDFPGYDATRYDAAINQTPTKGKLYTSVVANAAKYYGVVPLDAAASIGDVVINVEDIFTQIVPSTRVEIPISDARMNQQTGAYVPAGTRITTSTAAVFDTATSLFVGGTILPGSFSIARAGITLTDNGGTLVNGTTKVGTIDYANGILALASDVFGTSSGAYTVSYIPAGDPDVVTESIGIPVTAQSQRNTWLINLEPIPAKGSLTVSYRSLSHWYELNDDGSGALRGTDSSYGAGTINFNSGSVNVTFGALPDVGSEIIFTYAPAVLSTPIQSIPQSSPTNLPAGFGKRINIANAITPGSMVLSWNDGTPRTASDVNGKLQGDATGTVNYSSGDIDFRPNVLPPLGTSVDLTLSNSTPKTAQIGLMTDSGGTAPGAYWSFVLAAPIKPGSIDAAVVMSHVMRSYPGVDDDNYDEWLRVADDGAGNLFIGNITGNYIVGQVDYVSGACTINKSLPNVLSVQPTFITTVLDASTIPYVTKISQTGTENRSVTATVINGTGGEPVASPTWNWWGQTGAAAVVRYAGDDGTAQTFPFVVDNLFMASTLAQVLTFNLGSDFYTWAAGTSKYQLNPDPSTGVGADGGVLSIVGSDSGVLVSKWTTGAPSTPSNLTGNTQPDVTTQLAESVTFRTAISPLFNGGFSIQWTDKNGSQQTATANVDGYINAAGVVGVVNYDTGVATVRFGTVGDPSNTTTQDISYLNVPGVTTINPQGVRADSLRYNAVGYNYIPLDADVLGLDPVRLPPDGRVPIFQSGTVVVIGNTRNLGPVTVHNGQTLDCSQVRLSRVRLLGADGAAINVGYSADLEAGKVTFADVSTYDQPVTLEYRIEDASLVSDAQISGQLTLTKAITHNYPLQGSYVSSAMIVGDMAARVSTVYDQQTWTNVFSDDLIGNAATGTFNNIANPITVENIGALTERWAIVFTNTTTFNVIGEHVGGIAVGSTAADCSPINPATGEPYFTIPALGWGTGWLPGNVLRFDTVGAIAPVWVLRTIQQSTPTVDKDEFTLLIRGDINNDSPT